MVSGYVSWNRGENFGAAGMLGVTELHALNGSALESLLAVVGSFEAVTFIGSVPDLGNGPDRTG